MGGGKRTREHNRNCQSFFKQREASGFYGDFRCFGAFACAVFFENVNICSPDPLGGRRCCSTLLQCAGAFELAPRLAPTQREQSISPLGAALVAPGSLKCRSGLLRCRQSARNGHSCFPWCCQSARNGCLGFPQCCQSARHGRWGKLWRLPLRCSSEA